MNLLETFEELLQMWRAVFPQRRSFERARRLIFGLSACLRAHLTSNAICAVGRQFVDWSGDYRLLSRSPWDAHRLFDPVFDRVRSLLKPDPAPVLLAMDDTVCKKSGRKIPGVVTLRDPQSPPFHVNFMRGLRFVQASLLVSPRSAGPARALPVRFEPAPLPAKPKKTHQMKTSSSTASRRRPSASVKLVWRFWLKFAKVSINIQTPDAANSSRWSTALIRIAPC